jgi:hypothetical protein
MEPIHVKDITELLQELREILDAPASMSERGQATQVMMRAVRFEKRGIEVNF